MFDSYAYSFRFINLEKYLNDSRDSHHSSTFAFLVVVAFTNKEERKRQQAKPTHELLLNTVVFVCESHLLCDSGKCRLVGSRNQEHYGYC